MNIVAFEGIDGTGKTTLITTLVKFLKSKGVSVGSIANPCTPGQYSFAQRAHTDMQKGKHHAISKAMIYAAIVADNQKSYKKKSDDFMLMDRFLHSTFAYNIFYPLLTNQASFSADKTCNALIDLYLQCDLRHNNMPRIFIMLEAEEPINNKHKPMDYAALLEAHQLARPYMERLYDKMGLKYIQITLDPHTGPDEIADAVKKIIWGSSS